MAYTVLNRKKLKDNYQYLNQLFSERQIEWALYPKSFAALRLT